MTAQVLIAGTLFRKPETRTSKAGKSFVIATIKVRDGEATQWWKVLAFSESIAAEIARLDDGDAITVQGSIRVETYDKGGETRVSLTCIAERAIALRQPARPREKKAPAKRKPDTRARREQGAGAFDPALDDDLPF
jgi:single-stranded DNA-binding protein